MNQLATQPKPASFDLSPQTFDQALTFAGYLADSDMVPKDFKGKPGNCLIAMQWGMEIGLKPLQAMQNIAVINGRPSLWGDALIALARSSSVCEYILEEDNGDTATCTVKRRGEPQQSRTFSMADAKLAGLLGKAGPWTQYPKRMRQMRARAFAIRDVFPDVLKGLAVAEESQDGAVTEKHMGDAVQVEHSTPKAPDIYPNDLFAKNYPAWEKLITSGKKTATQIIAMVQSKHPLSDAQRNQINDVPFPVDGPEQPIAPKQKTVEQVMQMLGDAETHPGQRVGGQHMQPVQCLGHPQPGLIGMQYGCVDCGLSNGIYRRLQDARTCGGGLEHGGLADGQAKEVFHECRRALD